nr:6-phospho-3-hexuloisomerase [Saccharopolyspora hordei]
MVATVQDEISAVLARTDRARLEAAVAELDAAQRVFVAGAGRSGFMASAFAMRLVHLGSRAHVVGEATAPAMTTGDALVAVSGSGTTPGTVRAAEVARAAGGRVLAVTTDPSSPLAAGAHGVVHVPAATKHRRAGEAGTAQPLSSLIDQCAHLAELRRIDNAAAKQAHVTTE